MSDIAYVETIVNSSAAEHAVDVSAAVDKVQEQGFSVELTFQVTSAVRGVLYATLLTARKSDS